MRTFRRIAARSPFARLYHQDPLLLIAGIDAEVFHLGFIAIAQIIKPQAVLLLVHQGTELMLKLPALRSIQYALEHGILDALPIVHALLCNQAEPPPSCRILCVHIITSIGSLPEKRRIGIQIAQRIERTRLHDRISQIILSTTAKPFYSVRSTPCI